MFLARSRRVNLDSESPVARELIMFAVTSGTGIELLSSEHGKQSCVQSPMFQRGHARGNPDLPNAAVLSEHRDTRRLAPKHVR